MDRATILFMPGHGAFSAVFPCDALRIALMSSLVAAHRPEWADPAASADLDLEFPGLWLRPHAAGLNAAWLEPRLLSAAVKSGLPLEWIRVLLETPGTGPGREA
jgi:hypothetical protein